MLALVDVPDAFAEPFLTCQQVAAGVTGADVAVYGDVDGDGRMDLLAIDMYGGLLDIQANYGEEFWWLCGVDGRGDGGNHEGYLPDRRPSRP